MVIILFISSLSALYNCLLPLPSWILSELLLIKDPSLPSTELYKELTVLVMQVQFQNTLRLKNLCMSQNAIDSTHYTLISM